jgi:hypothetical protein
VPKWQLNQDGSFTTSPVVIATSQQALDGLGWTTKNPTWFAALAGTRPLAVPRIAEDAAGLSAAITLWQSLGKGEDAQRALAGTVLATGRDGAPTAAQAIQAAQSGSATAPLLPTSEQAVTEANKTAGSDGLVAIKPTGGSPLLDYPILTMLRPTVKAAGDAVDTRERAVRATVAQLLSSRSARLAKTAGFAEPESGADSGANAPTASSGTEQAGAGANPSPVLGLGSQELAGLVDRITALSTPSKFLAIFDLSGSMREPAGNGQSRITFAAAAAKLTGDLLTDRAQIGFWGFSRNLKSPKGTSRISKDIIKVEDIAELRNGAGSHREQLHKSMNEAGKLLGGNGTALYSAALAGMTEMSRQYDPRVGNAVVLFTDGANNDDGGPRLKATLAKLAALYDPRKPVRLMCVGIGDDVDARALRALSSKAGGQSFVATEPGQLPQFLFDVMNRR